MNLFNRLAEYKAANNLTFYDLGLETGLSDRTIRHILQGDNLKHTELTLYKLEQFFNKVC